MKKYLIILTIISSFTSYSQKITRGPDVGEIYFIGPYYSGLYYSTDFGQTATFIDGTMDYVSIAADKTKGGIYCIEYPINLYYSNDYGNTGTWEFKYADNYLSHLILSGVEEGHVFSDSWMHSEDYGSNFIVHDVNGWFGSVKHTTIDSENEEIGYAITYKLSQSDSLYLFKTTDTFENVNVIHQWDYHWSNKLLLSYGSHSGELFMVDFTQNIIWFSNNYGDDFLKIDIFNLTNEYLIDMVGGKLEGELFIYFPYVNSMWGIVHVYIFHSMDYGKTFEIFHPISEGFQPILANFSTINTEVPLTSSIEFSNFSIGDVIEYQWDFENDGIIDSYDEFPTHIYQDTGYYSVKLSVVGQDSTNSFIKENYIHVIDTTTNNPELKYQTISISPNPFNDKIAIGIKRNFEIIEIFDLNGKLHFSKALLQEHITEILDLRELEKGIYILKIRAQGQDLTKKIIKI